MGEAPLLQIQLAFGVAVGTTPQAVGQFLNARGKGAQVLARLYHQTNTFLHQAPDRLDLLVMLRRATFQCADALFQGHDDYCTWICSTRFEWAIVKR